MSLEDKIDLLKRKIEEQKKLVKLAITVFKLAKNLFKLNLQYAIYMAKAEAINEITKSMLESKLERKKNDA